jgi:DNA-binding NarL/FixJ family response regulator
VLAAIAQGQSNAAIARSLSITEKAVVQHTSHIHDDSTCPSRKRVTRRVLAVLRNLAE